MVQIENDIKIMNNNHYYRFILTGNKNRYKSIEQNLELNKDVYSNKKSNHKKISLIPESQVFDYSHNFDNNSFDVHQIKNKSESNQRVNTELIRSKYQLEIQSQKSDLMTAYYSKLRQRAQSYQQKKLEKIALVVDIGDSPIFIRDLKKSIDYSQSQKNKQRNMTHFQQKTIETQKFISQLNHFNQEQIMQFTFGLQNNKMNRLIQKSKFPKEIFLGDVRKVKRIFQQQ
ncbi:unnamed protein product [Paramecium pentaurelia]|uniref:Uncharacterized protein n=1 Tax=Paramecium pentaurelia TaxID=43138 RepID=A0A8S1TJR8_9CILI|nr:unnamed protein product [Paramecium pentaurelia]